MGEGDRRPSPVWRCGHLMAFGALMTDYDQGFTAGLNRAVEIAQSQQAKRQRGGMLGNAGVQALADLIVILQAGLAPPGTSA